MALIEIENLSVTFNANGRRVRAVQEVSLKVEEKASFGLVGESGSGKSTILRAICGLAPVSGGSIRIAGNIINKEIIESIEFACRELGTKLIIVLGHSNCGAVKYAVKNFRLFFNMVV